MSYGWVLAVNVADNDNDNDNDNDSDDAMRSKSFTS